ncbi:MAG: immunity 26/phosphotriesterase HocA family protein [Planctomycetaceae bacterium]|jgi:hypothetical protein|nr:immunity 26/phosphotriesterase HocA family protein [Planctomycetaceae bacterium]
MNPYIKQKFDLNEIVIIRSIKPSLVAFNNKRGFIVGKLSPDDYQQGDSTDIFYGVRIEGIREGYFISEDDLEATGNFFDNNTNWNFYSDVPQRTYKINYKEGDCFGFPLLGCSGFSCGVIARMDHKGTVLGYFFPKKYDRLTDITIDKTFCPQSAMYIHMFIDLSLVSKRWKIIGTIEPWNRNDWSIPVFGFVEPIKGTWGELRFYDDNLTVTRTKRITTSEIEQIPFEDGIAGDAYIEGKIALMLKSVYKE